MAKQKYYVVWVGLNPGVYTSWDACNAQIKGVKGAKYKSYKTEREAREAYNTPWQEIWEKSERKRSGGPQELDDDILSQIEPNSIAVDAACSGNPGKMEYRGVWTLSPETEVFRSKVYPLGTNNIGEFLALVHALAQFSKEKPDLTIYSDSRLAMGWIQKKQCRTKLPHNAQTVELFEHIKRAESWLKKNTFSNPIRKWETKKWGEIPADFGRK